MLLSTVHRIKGKEWGNVIVFGATEGLFPHRLSDDEEGERRVFHVALTRARNRVAVLADADAPSAFLGELDGSRPHRAPATPSTPPRPAGRRDQGSPARRKPTVRGKERGPAEALSEVGQAADGPCGSGGRPWPGRSRCRPTWSSPTRT